LTPVQETAISSSETFQIDKTALVEVVLTVPGKALAKTQAPLRGSPPYKVESLYHDAIPPFLL
jgi:hypothetical protein